MEHPGILAICHELGGGAQKFLLGKKKEWLESNVIFVSVTYQIKKGTYKIQIEHGMSCLLYTSLRKVAAFWKLVRDAERLQGCSAVKQKQLFL